MKISEQLEVVAQRMDNRKTQLIIEGGRRWRVTVAVARDHRDGRAVGFRSWVSPADVYENEDAAIAAALADIQVLAETPSET